MLNAIFSVYDSKAEAWIQPFLSQNLDTGIRAFATVARDPNHDFCRNGGDYCLFHLGEFDNQTGMITLNQVPQNLGLACNLGSEQRQHEPLIKQSNHLDSIEDSGDESEANRRRGYTDEQWAAINQATERGIQGGE